MIDSVTRKRIEIYGQAVPRLTIPEPQLRTVTDALHAGGFTFWVNDWTIKVDNEPALAHVTLSRVTDVSAVQRLLDSI